MMVDVEKLEELHAQRMVEAEVVEEEEDAEDIDETQAQTFEDLCKGVNLIRRCTVLLDFMSDPDLVRTISKREREAMIRMSDLLHAYNEDVTSGYEELQ